MSVQIIEGDCREVLAGMAPKSVQCVVTSPPFYGLRDYGHPAQIGLEATPEAYIAALMAVFDALWPVLRDDGVLWLNLGDSYAGSWGNYAPTGTAGQRPVQTERWARRAYADKTEWRPPTSRCQGGLKPKDLIGIPWMVAFALRARGWYLRSDCIWSKPNCMPESVQDRPTRSHEYLFLLSKREQYFYDIDSIREPHHGPRRAGRSAMQAQAAIRPRGNLASVSEQSYHPAGRNKRTVWTIATIPYDDAHFAVFPQALVEPCILAGTSEAGACSACGAPWRRVVERTPMVIRRSNRRERMGAHGRTQSSGTMVGPASSTTTGWQPTCRCDAGTTPCVVLDPFCGSGTTLLVARRLGRQAIGIEVNPDYVRMAERRVNAYPEPLFPAAASPEGAAR